MTVSLSTRARHDQLMTPNYVPSQMVPVRGEGVRVWDQTDRLYLDLTSGIAVTALGHAHPVMIQALTEQAQKLWHVSGWFTNEPLVALAQTLTDATFAERVFFCNSGAEANEAALKLARRYAYEHFGAQKNKVISTVNAFHGRTLFTVSAGGTEKYKQGFGPLPDSIHHIAYNDSEALKAIMDDQVCAVIIEPIQGEGGVRSATPEFLQTARALCNQHNALLILDEVQTGVGRTGSLYNYMQKGVTPDILTSAKGLGGGFPIAAMLTSAQFASAFSPGTHGTTYGGNPLACAVAKAVIDTIHTPHMYDNVHQRHAQFKKGLEAIGKKLGCFKEVRGEGLLMAAELAEPLTDQAQVLMNLGQEHGVLFLMAGYNVLRFTPALIIQEKEIEDALKLIEATLADALKASPHA